MNKYVDDNAQEESLNFENATRITVLGDPVRVKRATASQNVFRHITRRAEEKGMKVNTKKTNLLCISDSLNYKTCTYLEDRDGVRIDSGDKLKLLGWHFSSRPTVDAYLDVLKRRFRERYWVLRHLKHNGFTNDELLKVYTAIVRPVADYMSEIYHSMMTDGQDEAVERLQSHALRCIYGPRISARRMRKMAGLQTLRERRIERCDAFAAKCIQSTRFEEWFPKVPDTGRRTRRGGGEYVEEYARCNRLYNSPLFYMRRRLNGGQGRTYGERNKEYRQ